MKKLLIPLINKYLLEKGNPDYGSDYVPKPRVKPSDLGFDSLRRIFYSYLRVEPDQKVEPKLKRIFDTGDAFHEMIRGWVEGTGCLIKYLDPETNMVPIDRWSGKPNPEFPIKVEELKIKGKIDAVLIIDGKLWVGEFKSAKDSKWEPLDEPMDDHEVQANTYVHLFEYCLQRGDYTHISELEGFQHVEGVIYLYVNKNTTDLKEYVCEKKAQDLEPIIEKIAKIREFEAAGKLPPCRCSPKAWCPWNAKCAANFNPCKKRD